MGGFLLYPPLVLTEVRIDFEEEDYSAGKHWKACLLYTSMFLGLRKMEGVALTAQLQELYGELLGKLEREGVLAQDRGRIFLTDRGIDVSNYVLSEFLLDERCV